MCHHTMITVRIHQLSNFRITVHGESDAVECTCSLSKFVVYRSSLREYHE